MPNVVRFTLSSARDLAVPGAGTFIDGILDVDASNLERLARTRFLVQPYQAVEIGVVDAAAPPPALPAEPLPPPADPYPQYLNPTEVFDGDGRIFSSKLPARLDDAALGAAFVRRWQPSTAYAAGDLAVSPTGQNVQAKAAFTSGATYNAANWTVVAGGGASATPRLYSPHGLRRFRARLADADISRVRVLAVGHSVVFGKGAAGTNTETDAEAAVNSWPGRLRARFARDFGDPGEGWLHFGDSRVSIGTSTGAGTRGIFSRGRRLAAGQTMTITLPACTGFDLMIWKDSATNTGVPSYAVDGAAAVTPAQPATGNDYFAIIPVTGLTDAPHTVVLSGPATGSATVSAIAARRSATGVAVSRLAVASAKIGDLTTAATFTADQQDSVRRATFIGTDAHLVILEFQSYDQQGQTPLADWRARHQAIIDKVVGNGGCVLLLGDPDQGNPAAGIIQSQYADELVKLAADNDHVAYLSIADLWGTYGQGAAADMGLYVATSTTHPSRRGYGDIANLLYTVLTNRMPAGVSVAGLGN